jgi:hypothetical protein
LEGCEDWEEIMLDFKAYSTYPREVAGWLYSGLFMFPTLSFSRRFQDVYS